MLFYNNLSYDETKIFISILSEIMDERSANEVSDENDFIFNRIMSKLTERRNILSDNVSKVRIKKGILGIEGEFLIEDYVQSYITIETYKNAWNKIRETDARTLNDYFFKMRLIDCFNISKINELSAFTLMELYGKSCNFDIENLPSIDISPFLNNEMIKDIILDTFCKFAIASIKAASEFLDSDNSIDDVYETLLILSEFEVLLSIIDLEGLQKVSSCYDDYFIDENESIVAGSIKKLIRKKEEEIK